MPPEGYVYTAQRDFWDTLMDEQGVKTFPGLPGGMVYERQAPNYNVGDVLVGEIVEERKELT